MSLKTLTSILKSGNAALGQKLCNLLTEDCTILEYTDDAVLFQKNNYLVIAKFKHNLAEAKMTSDDILDNEVIYVSAKDTEKELKESLFKLIDNLVEDDYVTAEEDMRNFCEEFYQFNLLRTKFPQTFTENLVKKAPGFKLRKKATSQISEFKSEVFSLATLAESKEFDVAECASLIETCGCVLFLGKTKVLPIVEDALLGNKDLAEILTEKLFETAKTLTEANDDISHELDNGYKLDDGKFENEEDDDIEGEDYSAPEDIENEFPEEEEGKHEFEEFDPSKLSDEEIKELHKTVLLSILNGMSEFVSREANNPENAKVNADLDDKLKHDIDVLNSPELADDELSSIEAQWHPVLEYFLDSDLYTPEQDLGAEEIELKNDDEGEDPDSAEEPEEEGEPTEELGENPMGQSPELPQQEPQNQPVV